MADDQQQPDQPPVGAPGSATPSPDQAASQPQQPPQQPAWNQPPQPPAQPGWGQPQQPPQQPAWNQPPQQPPAQPGWNQPPQQPQPGWNQPPQPQQPAWNQPPQPPAQPGWGQPQQPPQQPAWNQPPQPQQQPAWNQPPQQPVADVAPQAVADSAPQPQPAPWGQQPPVGYAPQPPAQPGWGQPPQQPQPGWGQPPQQPGWGQPQSNNQPMGFGPSGLSLGPGKATFPMSLVIAGGGAALAFLGWMLGLLFTSTTYAIGYGYGSYSVSWYGPSGAQGVGILAVLIAVASVALVFVNNTPSMKIVWPVPFHVILLVVSGVGALFGLLGLFFALTFGTGVGVDMGKPITLLLAAGAVFAGGVVQTVAAYMEYAAKSKKPV